MSENQQLEKKVTIAQLVLSNKNTTIHVEKGSSEPFNAPCKLLSANFRVGSDVDTFFLPGSPMLTVGRPTVFQGDPKLVKKLVETAADNLAKAGMKTEYTETPTKNGIRIRVEVTYQPRKEKNQKKDANDKQRNFTANGNQKKNTKDNHKSNPKGR